MVTPAHERSFGCVCTVGFGGERCTEPVNECSRAPCPVHKDCVPVTSRLGYVCRCPFGKAGQDCNQAAETCLSNDREEIAFCFAHSSPLTFNGSAYILYELSTKQLEPIFELQTIRREYSDSGRTA